MMRLNISQTLDGINYHAEVDSFAEAKEVQAFLDGRYKEAVGIPLEQRAAEVEKVQTTMFPPQPANLGVKAPDKWTRESLQPIVVGLAKQRDKFVAILEQFGVARFRDLPDDKLNDFGMACAAVQPSAVAA